MTLSRRFLLRVAGTVLVLGALFGAYAAVPLFVDANAWKPALAQAVKEATGRELVIDGRMRLRMFPQPRLSVQRVHFANAKGGTGAQMVEVRWVGATPSLWALLQGRLEVSRLILSHPVIVLETDADGVPNWQFRPGAGAEQPEGAEASGFHLAIGELKIIKGTISYTNPQTRQTVKATEVDVTASVGSLQGPLSIKGLATVNEVPLSVDLALGAPSAKGQDLSFLLQVLNGRLEFKGRIDGLRPDASFKGRLYATTGELTEFVGSIVRAIGRDSAFDSASIERFTFDGAVDITPTRVALDAFTLVAGSESASGRLSLETDGRLPRLEGQVAMPRFDLGRWLALLDQPGLFAWPLAPAAVPPTATTPPPPGKGAPAATSAPPAKGAPPATSAPPGKGTPPAAGSSPRPSATPPAPAAPPAPPPIFSRFEASLRFDVAELAYRDGSARDVVAAVELHGGRLTVPELKAALPGGATLAASLKPDGAVDLSGPRLRDTLAWLGLDTRAVPADRLLAFALTGHVIGVPVGLQIPDLALAVDGQKASGSVGLALGPPPAVTVSLQADQFDLDPYLPPPAVVVPAPAATPGPAAPRPDPGAPRAAAPAPAPVAAPAAPDKDAVRLALKAKVSRLRLNQQTLRGLEADTVLQSGVFKVNAVKIADLLGGKIDARGSISSLSSRPRFDVAFNAAFPEGDRVAAYAGLPWFANGHIGPASASGGLSGTADSLALRDVSVSMLGLTARASGTLGLAPSFHFEFPTFTLQANDLAPLIAAASGQPASGAAGALAVEGAFRGDAARAAFDGTLQVLGASLGGTIEASLGQRPNVSARLRAQAPLDLNAVLGLPARTPPGAPPPSSSGTPAAAPSPAPAAPAPPQASAGGGDRPINFAALRSIDASLALQAPSVQVDVLKLDELGLEATLRNGLLTVGRLAAGVYDGSVELAGTIDATRDSLGIDLKGNLRGVDLGQLLRGTAGRNSFGNDSLMLAVDGKVDITDFAIQGGGGSVDELRDALVGRGRIGGHLDTKVASGSLGLASFATGLGSIFSTELGFGSAMLAGFVNHQSALAGDLGLANSVVSLRKQTIRGHNALASIDSDINLREGVTDTTVRLDVGVTDTIDYVFTVKGPLSAPVFATRGGTARDSQPRDIQSKDAQPQDPPAQAPPRK